MFKELKLKLAARRVQNKNTGKTASRRRNSRKPTTKWGRFCHIICAPFRALARLFKNIWARICRIDLIGLVNLTLLIAIIVLFSLLIIDIVNCNKKSVVIVADAPSVAVTPDARPQVVMTNDAAPANIAREKVAPALPLKRDPVTRKYIGGAVSASHVKCSTNKTAQAAPVKLYGDIIIDRRNGDPVLTNGVQIHGNLYLQNMRKYTLPCGVQIDGNLFLRDVAMLQFCGDFTVKGNIYVSPRSSFGPIPRTARLGGQVIL